MNEPIRKSCQWARILYCGLLICPSAFAATAPHERGVHAGVVLKVQDWDYRALERRRLQ